MKTKLLFLFIILFLFVTSLNSDAQDSGNKLIVNGIITHFDRSGEVLDIPGFYKFPVDPGVEILYQFPIQKSLSLNAGVCFQWIHFANYIHTEDRFKYSEISIPVIVRKNINIKDKSIFYISSGFYGGKVSFLDWERVGKPDWKNVSSQYDEHYSSSNFFVDFYLDCGILYPFKKQNSIAFIPFLKYRVKENWMEYHKQSFSYGLKVSYEFNFKHNKI